MVPPPNHLTHGPPLDLLYDLYYIILIMKNLLRICVTFFYNMRSEYFKHNSFSSAQNIVVGTELGTLSSPDANTTSFLMSQASIFKEAESNMVNALISKKVPGTVLTLYDYATKLYALIVVQHYL